MDAIRSLSSVKALARTAGQELAFDPGCFTQSCADCARCFRNMDDTITICGEEFERRHIPRVARMFDTSPENAAKTITSLAFLWHEGSIVSAVQALESDLAHG